MKFGIASSRRWGLGLLGLVLLGGFGWVVARSGPLAPTRVTVTQLTRASVTPALFGVGTVEARRAYLIGPTSAGRVLRVQVDVGEPVQAGQLLAEMDPVDLDARIAALDASIERAGSSMSAAQAQRHEARARAELAAVNVRRYVDLGERNFVSGSAIEVKVQEQTSAQASLSAAEANVSGAQQDLLRLKSEREGLRQQRANLRLLAPAATVVTAREAEPGSTVVAGQAVLRLVEPASLWLRVRFDQGRSIGLAPGLKATITLRSDPQHPLAGKVARLELVGDAVTEERIALVAFERVPAGVAIGELAEVTLQLAAEPATPVLPNASVQRQGEQTGVWLLSAGQSRFMPVRFGRTGADGRVQVLDGLADLAADAAVVVHSEKPLSEGRRLQVVDALPRAGT